MVDVDCAVGAVPCLTAADDAGYEIDDDGLAVERFGRRIGGDLESRVFLEIASLQKKHIGVRVARRLGAHVQPLLRTESRIECISDITGKFALQIDRISQFAVIAFRPNLVSIAAVDQRDMKEHPVAQAAQATF